MQRYEKGVKELLIQYKICTFAVFFGKSEVQTYVMKLILLTNTDFFVEEDKILTTLFEEGLDILHLRKPDSEPVYCERLISLIPKEFHSRIVVHDHFYLCDEFDLMGIHLNRRHPEMPVGYKGPSTRTCYSLEELQEHKQHCQYVFLRNIYDSISEPDNKASFSAEEIKEAVRKGLIDKKVIAEGGVSLENIPELKSMGFGGVVVRGDLWKRFNIHSERDFKELIAHFRRLRKAAG